MSKKQSVIQSTLIKITVLVFCILVILYFIIARVYWDKELLERKADLLSLAWTGENIIQNDYLKIQQIKANPDMSNNEKINAIDILLKDSFGQISKKRTSLNITYFDRELDYSGTNPIHNNEMIIKIKNQTYDSVIPEFVSDKGFLKGERNIAVVIPVYFEELIVGHALVMDFSPDIFYEDYLGYSSLFIPSILLLIIVSILIKNSIAQIKLSLDAFTNSIFGGETENREEIEKLPELKPVFEAIRTYMENLQDLNMRLEDTNDKLLTIMEGISDGFFSLDRRWRFTFINKEMKRIINKEDDDVIGKYIWEEFPEMKSLENIKNLSYASREKIPIHWETQSELKGGYYEFHAYPFAKGLTVFFRDITDIKKREIEMVRLERLNLIGQMAAGISHEVRNPLTTVRGFLQMLEGKSESERNKEFMEIAISEIDRANRIITDFLSLAKANIDESKYESINAVILRIFPMLEADAFNSNKEVVINLGEVPEIKINESEIRQLTLNLVRNALEATPEGGQVNILTYAEDAYIVLTISDEGTGIPLEVQEKIGTPFVTTKDNGTGLGLAISIGIANRHQAKFEFETGPNGTTFYIKFPQASST